ncbi:hydroxyethylthiazole kinase [Alkalicoccobacillus porphyridii]|uniref:Hydroxyethylthiazole kinase n=1 Tax=Alkalicoccobacillus porphyridii TaxID=2597270 RepID=A0A554A4K4_9BACI|nr:hydroxyethylthiazole kinase [Alkalicoccobacillus porphyridii]
MNKVKEINPLVHCMTNMVVTTFTANGLLALGASPVMAYAKEEVEDMAGAAGALLLNIGTPSVELAHAMILAGKAANKAGKPVILDPVGAGATPFRTQICHQILEEVDVTIIRGNAGEAAALLGLEGTVKGVDGSLEGDKLEVAKQLANTYQCIAVVTGDIDVITDGSNVQTIANGHEWLTKIVGAGCLLGGVVAAFAAVSDRKDDVETAASAVSYYGVAAEKAFQETKKEGFGSFAQSFINQLGMMTEDEARSMRREAR